MGNLFYCSISLEWKDHSVEGGIQSDPESQGTASCLSAHLAAAAEATWISVKTAATVVWSSFFVRVPSVVCLFIYLFNLMLGIQMKACAC